MIQQTHTLAWAHPLVRDWFMERFGAPSEPQEQGWPHIVAGRDVLISAPTGSGKTLAAFLACIDRLARQGIDGALPGQVKVLYVSPLKALGNDIHKNLEVPLRGIMDLAARRDVALPEIRTAVRSGDTPAPERRAMLKNPPQILVTTPESLYILLTAEKSRAILQNVETVIVDEIHAVADDKRGAHLALSLERLDSLVRGANPGRPAPVRIGLSATQKPIEEVARFLAGTGRPMPEVVNVGHRRAMDLAVEVPAGELGPVATEEMWEDVYNRISGLALEHRSTLVFVNTRRLVERLAHHLAERMGEESVAAHHGSLSRRLRLEAEKRLKSGEARVMVATASLELGIDIGMVDLVCQISSTRSIGVALQRIGRAGHWRGAVPKGRLFAMTRDDLVECAGLVRAIHQGDLDRLEIPAAPLDILAQQIVAMCACEEWKEDDLFLLVRRAFPYARLSRRDFDEIVAMLSEGISARRGRHAALLYRDRVNGRVRGRRGSRLAAITGGGAIPDSALFSVVSMPEGTMVGTVDEDFAVESMAGDIMLLGNTSWRIRHVEAARSRLLVEDAHGAAPNVPFWRGEAPSRTAELSAQVSGLREIVTGMAEGPVGIGRPQAEVIDWLKSECGLDESGAGQLIVYLRAGRSGLGATPTLRRVIAERFFDEAGGMQLIIHAPFGGRINKAWGLALRKRFCRSFNFELQAAATDNGLNISLGEQHSFPLADVFRFLDVQSVEAVLEQAVLASPIFNNRWRWDASRSLALRRFRQGHKVPIYIQRMQADDLLAAVFPEAAACQENIVGDINIPDHPLIREVMKDALTEAMDIEGLKRVLRDISSGAIECRAVDTAAPSAFSHEILNANPYAFLDDAPLEERRARAVELRRVLPESIVREVGGLDSAAIAQVCREAWPDVRDADDLADVLQTLVALPQNFVGPGGEDVNAAWAPYFSTLSTTARATRGTYKGVYYWIAAEKSKTFQLVFPESRFEHAVQEIEGSAPSRDDAIREMVRGWMDHLGPVSAGRLAQTLGLQPLEIEQALLRLEQSGSILRGQFTASDKQEWCDRRLLARIHRLTIGKLRAQIAPVTPSQFMQWLLHWQHVAPGTQAHGERGLLEVLRQLQGFEIPASSWEEQILARRVADYNPQLLDRLCLTGAVGWGRISPHPAILAQAGSGEGREVSRQRVVPSSVAPIAFFLREDADWIGLGGAQQGSERGALSHAGRQVFEFLEQRGASFFADIVRGSGRLKSEVETALWELVAAGRVTADGFDNLRALIDPKRRSGLGRAHTARPRHSSGRWSLLFSDETPDRVRATESICKALLERYGVVFRELTARESFPLKWREMLQVFRRMEDRGEIRGGRFVDGFIGEQFGLPAAVESLRAIRNTHPSGETVTLSSSDPLNLVGIIIPGGRVPALSKQRIIFRDGTSAVSAPVNGEGDAHLSPVTRRQTALRAAGKYW
ncbi:MAG: DEAD/DEAH box helicase [Acidobacteria bacterium]|nr:MAG: DEAD/DEAH box helicase [Acidobacteriota bacterium]